MTPFLFLLLFPGRCPTTSPAGGSNRFSGAAARRTPFFRFFFAHVRPSPLLMCPLPPLSSLTSWRPVRASRDYQNMMLIHKFFCVCGGLLVHQEGRGHRGDITHIVSPWAPHAPKAVLAFPPTAYPRPWSAPPPPPALPPCGLGQTGIAPRVWGPRDTTVRDAPLDDPPPLFFSSSKCTSLAPSYFSLSSCAPLAGTPVFFSPRPC